MTEPSITLKRNTAVALLALLDEYGEDANPVVVELDRTIKKADAKREWYRTERTKS